MLVRGGKLGIKRKKGLRNKIEPMKKRKEKMPG